MPRSVADQICLYGRQLGCQRTNGSHEEIAESLPPVTPQRYLKPLPVLKRTIRLSRSRRPAPSELLRRGPDGAALRRDEEALGTRRSRRTRARISSSVTATAEPPDARTSRRIRKSAKAFGTRSPEAYVARVRPLLRDVLALGERLRDRRAAVGLDRDHPRPLRADPAELLHLVEGLPHADQARAAAGRIDDRVGQLPAEVLGELVAHRLLALDAVRLLERRDVVPALARRAFRRRSGRSRRSGRRRASPSRRTARTRCGRRGGVSRA